MGKTSLFDPASKQQILKRIDSLTPTSAAKWGKMTVRQGLHHMNMGLQMPLGDFTIESKGNVFTKAILKFFLLSVPPPKGKAETFPIMNMVARSIDPQDFEAERTALKQTLHRFTTATSFLDENPMAGRFSKDDWGRLQYNHMNHHLSQFGA